MIVIVTGASSGIGLATAKLLASLGHKVYGLSRHPLENQGFIGKTCDMTNFDQTKQVFEEIFQAEGKIDALVNNAGMGIAGAIEHTDMQDVYKQFDLNLMAVINACKCITPYMRKQGGGRIVNISSIAGVVPIAFQTCYSTSKAAVDMFSMSYGLEVKDFGIKVSVVMPGDTKTGFTNNRVKNEIISDEYYKDRIQKSIEGMEKDEKNGQSPERVAKLIAKVLTKKNPPSRAVVSGVYKAGLTYKFAVFLIKIVPRRFMLFVLKKLYG